MAVINLDPNKRTEPINEALMNAIARVAGAYTDQQAIQRVQSLIVPQGQSGPQPQTTGEATSSSTAGQGQQKGGQVDMNMGITPPDPAALAAAAGNSHAAQLVAQGAMQGYQLRHQQQQEAIKLGFEQRAETRAVTAQQLQAQKEKRLEQHELANEKRAEAQLAIAQRRADLEEMRVKLEAETKPLQRQNLILGIRNKQLEISQKQHDLDLGDKVDKAPIGAKALDGLPEGEKFLVQGMIDGKIQPPSSFALARPVWQHRLEAAEKATGGQFDETIWAQRHKTQTDYAPGGAVGKSIQAGNNAIPHLQLWIKAHEALQNGDTRGYNALIQTIRQATIGNPELAGVTNVRDILSEELRKFFAGAGGGSLSEFQEWQKNLAQKQTPAEAQATGKAIMGLLGAQYHNYSDQYGRIMGQDVDPYHFMTPSAKKAWQEMGGQLDTSIGATPGLGTYKTIDDLKAAVDAKKLTPSQARDLAIQQGLAQ